MPVQLHIPTPPLNQWIECFWYVDLQVPYTREKILPGGTIELMINFGSPHKRYNQAETAYDLMCESWIAGLQTGFIVNEPVAETCMMGVRFKPGGAFPFLNLPLTELTNEIINLDCIWGQFAHTLREQLLEEASIPARFARLEQLLSSQLNQNWRDQDIIHYAVNGIMTTNGALSFKTVSHEIGISQKHLITQFKKSVGVSPKQLSKIVRFQKALQAINPSAPTNWRQIAHACDYYDQSHFNRDFAAFTGMSPTNYLTFRQSLLDNPPGQGVDVNFVPIIG